MIKALRPDGLLYYQTFIENKDPTVGPSNPAFLLRRNELLQLTAELSVLVYHEDAQVGDLKSGWRNEAALVAQKHTG